MENQNPKAVMTNSENGLTGNQRELNHQDKIIIAMKCEKLMYVKSQAEKFLQLLARLNAILGGNSEKLPSGETFDLFLLHARNNWYNYSFEEIELAVICNIERKNDEFVQFYGSISIQYIADCLYHYNNTKRKAVLRQKALQDSQRPPGIKTEDKEHFEFIRDWYSKHGEFPFADYYHAFDYAWKEKMFANIDLNQWMEERKQVITAELAKKKSLAGSLQEREELLKQMDGDSLRIRLRREAVQMYLEANCITPAKIKK